RAGGALAFPEGQAAQRADAQQNDRQDHGLAHRGHEREREHVVRDAGDLVHDLLGKALCQVRAAAVLAGAHLDAAPRGVVHLAHEPPAHLAARGGARARAGVRAAPGTGEPTRFCSGAPTAAGPTPRPPCLRVSSTPGAAPATRGSMLRMATVTSGAKMQPMPIPATISGATNVSQLESGCAIRASQPIPAPNRIRPDMRMYLPPILSVVWLGTGGMNIDMTEAGAMTRRDLSAENPRTDWK